MGEFYYTRMKSTNPSHTASFLSATSNYSEFSPQQLNQEDAFEKDSKITSFSIICISQRLLSRVFFFYHVLGEAQAGVDWTG